MYVSLSQAFDITSLVPRVSSIEKKGVASVRLNTEWCSVKEGRRCTL